MYDPFVDLSDKTYFEYLGLIKSGQPVSGCLNRKVLRYWERHPAKKHKEVIKIVLN